MTTTDLQERTRRLRNAMQPMAAGVYFAPESHAAYEALGFDGSPAHQGGVDRPNMTAYFTSRGACMGQVTGAVVVAAFGCFNPQVAAPAVDAGWKISDRGSSVISTRGLRRSSTPVPIRRGSRGSMALAAGPTRAPA